MVNADTLRERIRERLMNESDYDTICANCQATLTVVDREAEECTNCHSAIDSDDEHLYEDGDY